MKKTVRNILVIVFAALGVFLIGLFLGYQILTSPVNRSNGKMISVEIPSGSSLRQVARILKEEKLIRNDFFFLGYAVVNGKTNVKASTYSLSQKMSLEEILEHLTKGNSYNPDEVEITFKEGMNIRQMVRAMEAKTNHTYDEIMEKMNDPVWIGELISQYWFLTEEIQNKDIIYPLEGYLFPDTYRFKNKDVSIEEMVTTMLNQMGKVLEKEKEAITQSDYTIHQMLSLASIVELEGASDEDRDMIAQVLYNRLNYGWSLGSDVTACYGFKVDVKDCKDNVDYRKYNPYNTRSSQMAGKLPVGPVGNPSKKSILASIYPKENDYFYFVADKYRKVYFTKTEKEHLAMIKEIKDRGEWPW